MMDRHLFARITAVGIMLLVARLGPAFAQEPPTSPQPPGKSLEDLVGVEVASVYTAARHAQRLGDAPASVTVITAEDIATFGWRTLADVLNSVRGFYITNDSNYSYVGVNGFGRPTDYNNRVLVLVDGHRANDNIYDGALLGTEFPIDLALISRIEVIRGPGSALYGTSAFFAVVNLVTKGGGSIGTFEGAVEVASERLFRARATYGAAPTSDRQWMLSASRYSSDGAASIYYPEYDDPRSGSGITRGTDGDEATSIFGSGQFGAWSFQGLFGSRTKHVPTGSWGATFDDPRNRTVDTRGWVNVKRHSRLRNTDLVGRASFDHVGYAGTYVYDPDVYTDHARGNWLTGELATDTVFSSRLRLGVGLEARKHFDQDQWGLYDSDPDTLEPDSFVQSSQFAFYGQAELVVLPRTTVTLGGRFDAWSLGPEAWKPRVGVVFHPVSDGSLKVLHGGAFRSPTVYEMEYFLPQPTKPPLKPEEVTTTEVVYEHLIAGRVRLGATAFRTRIRQLISEEADDAEFTDLYFVNRDDALANGVGADLEVRWASGVLIRGGYSYQRVRDQLTGQSLSNAPHHTANGGLAVPLLERRLTAAVNITHVSSRLTYVLTPLDGATVANANVQFRPRGSALTVAAGIYNLFDTDYAHPVGAEFVQSSLAQPGRTASIRASVQF